MERNNQHVVLSREELYAQVWAEPMTKMARKYGLSDRGLAKLCDRMGIPTPGRGYWSMLQSGHKVKQVALPALKAGQQEKVCLNLACRVEEGPEDLPPAIAFELDPVNRIEVPEELTKPHQVVRATARRLRAAKVDDFGVVRLRSRDCVDVRIGKASMTRVSRVLNALIRALETRGIRFVESQKDGEGLRLLVDGEALEFRIEETSHREHYQPTAAERKMLDKDPNFRWRLPREKFIPSGKLSLKLGPLWRGRGFRTTWNDGKRQ